MQIQHADLETCAAATGVVVVIDVIRAFTTAAFAFAAGAREDWPEAQIKQFRADLECCTALDRFDFALPVAQQNGRWVMRAASA